MFHQILDAEFLSKIKAAAPTRTAMVSKELATPKDLELYKDTYENLVLVGSGTFGSVYCAR